MKRLDNNTLTSLSLAWIAFLGLTIWTFHSEGFEVWFPVALLISGAALIIGESIVLRFRRQSHSEDRGKLSADE
jgi:putative exporter of polyketide antibiotics